MVPSQIDTISRVIQSGVAVRDPTERITVTNADSCPPRIATGRPRTDKWHPTTRPLALQRAETYSSGNDTPEWGAPLELRLYVEDIAFSGETDRVKMLPIPLQEVLEHKVIFRRSELVDCSVCTPHWKVISRQRPASLGCRW